MLIYIRHIWKKTCETLGKKQYLDQDTFWYSTHKGHQACGSFVKVVNVSRVHVVGVSLLCTRHLPSVSFVHTVALFLRKIEKVLCKSLGLDFWQQSGSHTSLLFKASYFAFLFPHCFLSACWRFPWACRCSWTAYEEIALSCESHATMCKPYSNIVGTGFGTPAGSTPVGLPWKLLLYAAVLSFEYVQRDDAMGDLMTSHDWTWRRHKGTRYGAQQLVHAA